MDEGNVRLSLAIQVNPADPLWQRAPTHDKNGRMLSDFMMIIPKLHHQPAKVIRHTITLIEQILLGYQRYVVFADLNLKLNVLWVSVISTPGICLEVATAIHASVPQAKLVAQKMYTA